MNAPLAKIADNWTCEYDFSELEIEIDGVSFGSFSGSAELALNDARYGDFYVSHIVVNGTKRVRRHGSILTKRIDAKLHLPRPSTDSNTFSAHLFRAISAALYADEQAAEFFTEERRA